ncbi:MAG TPA: tetratricopeptide repeat protein, partial [Steroidobacteraceae bacterium]|nr:tetratricopeptide repeat protein [Steroidobacteraceae bacterium]
MSGQPQQLGSVEVALRHASQLLREHPTLAAEQAAEILKVVPEHPMALLFLAVARRVCGDPAAALGVLQPLCDKQPRWAVAQYELGVTLGALGQGDAAIAALRRAVELNPDMSDAWRTLGDHLTAIGDVEGA